MRHAAVAGESQIRQVPQRLPAYRTGERFGLPVDRSRHAAGRRRRYAEAAEFNPDWRIPKPDVIVRMPEPFTVPAKGIVPYQYFTVDPGFKEDKWVRSAEGRPGNRSVVHHMLLFYIPPGKHSPSRWMRYLNAVASFVPECQLPMGRKPTPG